MDILDIIEKEKNGSLKPSKRANANGIYKVLKGCIENKLRHNQKLPAISELAKGFNANYRTVKSALTKLEQDGLVIYEPNIGAVVNQKLSIAYIRWEGNAFCGAMSDGAKRFCSEQDGVDLVIIEAHKNHQRVVEGIYSISNIVNGILIMPFDLKEYKDALEDMINQGKKIVMVDRILHGINASSVTVDDFGGTYQAVSHLLNEHNRPVYYLGNSGVPSSSHNRYIGWQEAMREYGFFETSQYCIDIKITESDSTVPSMLAYSAEIDAVERLFKQHPEQKYSIFAGNDIFASKIYMVAEKYGLVIGKDVFVVGFGNMALCENLSVKLTSVEQSAEKVGYEAAKLLYDLLNGKLIKPVHKVLPTNLIIRDSSRLISKT